MKLITSFTLFFTIISLVRAAVTPGDKAPEFTLAKILQGPKQYEKWKWSDHSNKLVVIEFWATWCGPCVVAIPHWNELVKKHSKDSIIFLAITAENEEPVEKFLSKKPMSGWLGLDDNKSANNAFGITGIPTTIIVNTQGKIAWIGHPDVLDSKIIEEAMAGKIQVLPKRNESKAPYVPPPFLSVYPPINCQICWGNHA